MCSTKTPPVTSSSALSNNLLNDHRSFLACAAPQVISWSFWYVAHDEVFMADTGGQALHIFHHSPASAQMTVIVTSYIPSTFMAIHTLKIT